MTMTVQHIFDPDTSTFTYVVSDSVTSRDATPAMPTLILPSLQVNMRGGHLPPLDSSGRMFLKVPVNAFGGRDLSSLTETGR